MNNHGIKIVVINLPTSVERRAYISRRLSDLGLSYSFFDAVNGKEGNDPGLFLYNNQKRLFEKGHSLTPGEQGCFASHRAIWELCVSENSNILVLEDDVELDDCLPAMLSNCEELLNSYHYIRLGRGTARRSLSFLRKWKVEDELNGEHSLVKYLRGPSCAHAYIITPISAKRFLSASQEWWWPVDDYMDMEYLNDQYNYGIEPPLVIQRGVVSDIGGVKKPKRTVPTRIRKEYFRLIDMIRRNIFNARYLISKQQS